MGNSISSDTNASVCCIPIEDFSVSDESTIRAKPYTKKNMIRSSEFQVEDSNLLTREEKDAITSNKTVPTGAKIQEGYSFSSISSKSSSANSSRTGVQGQQQLEKEQRKNNTIFISNRRHHLHHHHEMDEMRNDACECCNSMSDEIRANVSSYDETTTAALNSYYSPDSRRGTMYHQRNANSRSTSDEMRE